MATSREAECWYGTVYVYLCFAGGIRDIFRILEATMRGFHFPFPEPYDLSSSSNHGKRL
jgi:hypothetical protein